MVLYTIIYSSYDYVQSVARRLYESQMAQRRAREQQTQEIQQRLQRDAANKANFESERRVDYLRRTKRWEQEDQERAQDMQLERVWSSLCVIADVIRHIVSAK